MNAKQVIVLRKDLKMRKGKMVAQGSHAVQYSILQNAKFTEEGFSVNYSDFGVHAKAMKEWLEGKHKKIAVSVNSLEELHELEAKAREKGLMVNVVTDSGLTEFGGVPTVTGMSIGPAEEEFFTGLTDHLQLL